MASKETIRQLYERHYDRMHLAARLLLHDDEESRDAVGEVFAGIADGRIEVRADTAEGFLLTCVRNRCLKMIRAKQVRERVHRLLPLGDEAIEMMPMEAQTDRLAELLRYSEEALTPQTLRVFRLRFGQRMSYAGIAQELGISEAAVYKHLAQAIRKIKSHFNP